MSNFNVPAIAILSVLGIMLSSCTPAPNKATIEQIFIETLSRAQKIITSKEEVVVVSSGNFKKIDYEIIPLEGDEKKNWFALKSRNEKDVHSEDLPSFRYRNYECNASPINVALNRSNSKVKNGVSAADADTVPDPIDNFEWSVDSELEICKVLIDLSVPESWNEADLDIYTWPELTILSLDSIGYEGTLSELTFKTGSTDASASPSEAPRGIPTYKLSKSGSEAPAFDKAFPDGFGYSGKNMNLVPRPGEVIPVVLAYEVPVLREPVEEKNLSSDYQRGIPIGLSTSNYEIVKGSEPASDARNYTKGGNLDALAIQTDVGTVPSPTAPLAQMPGTADQKLVTWASDSLASAISMPDKLDSLGCSNPGDSWSDECLTLLEDMPTEMGKATAGITGLFEQYGTPETASLEAFALSARNAASYSYTISQKAVVAGCLSQNTPQQTIPRGIDGELVPCFMFFATSYWHQYAENVKSIVTAGG